jgi:hypothetical protein
MSLAKRAASKALAMPEEPFRPGNLVETREQWFVCGQIYSAIGQANVAKRYLNEVIMRDPYIPAVTIFYISTHCCPVRRVRVGGSGVILKDFSA